jgi:hypothetical protein
MARYRLYLLDAASYLIHAADLDAEDDGEALDLVRIRQEPTDVELWCGERMVVRISREEAFILGPFDVC